MQHIEAPTLCFCMHNSIFIDQLKKSLLIIARGSILDQAADVVAAGDGHDKFSKGRLLVRYVKAKSMKTGTVDSSPADATNFLTKN